MLTVAFFPSLNDLAGNPYWRLLAEALETRGVHVVPDNPRFLALRWLWARRRQVQVLHVHYFQDNYAYEGRARLRWVFRFARNLIAARLLGYRVVWTVHNETPSFPLPPQWVEDLAHLALARLAHAVIVHCEYARELVARRYGRSAHVHVVPHPSLLGVYEAGLDRVQARRLLGLPQDTIVFLCFGELRPHKGIEGLLSAFSALPGDRQRLVVAGVPGPDRAYVERLQCLASVDKRVCLFAKRIPDDQIQMYHAAADVAVTPFTRVLTSSTVMLALSMGKPVIAPRLGCLPELIATGAGWLYDPEAPECLLEALKTALSADLERAGQNALRAVVGLTWKQCATDTARAYGCSS